MKRSVLILLLSIAFLMTGCVSEGGKKLQVLPETETVVPENIEPEQSNLPGYDIGRMDEYMASVREQSDAIKVSMEQDVLTQTAMNEKSRKLYELWNEALNLLLGELESCLPEEEFAKLQVGQEIWTAEKEKATEQAGQEFEGGSIYPLIVNSEAAGLTEERVYELYDMLKTAAGE